MSNTRTRALPAMVLVLVAVPAATWTTLIVLSWVFAATDKEPPVGGFWSIGLALAIITPLGAFGIWAFGAIKAHISSEFGIYYGMWCHRSDSQVTQPILRAVGTAMVVATPVEPPPDNVRSFELGRQVGRREGRDN